METKTCKDCGQTLPLVNFYKQRKDSDKYLNVCKACYTKRYYPDQVARELARAEGKQVSKEEAQKILDEAAKVRKEQAALRKANRPAKQMTNSEYYAAYGAVIAPIITLAEQATTKDLNALARKKADNRVPVYRVSITPAGKTKPIVARVPASSEYDAANKALALEPVQKYLNGDDTDAVVAVEVFFRESVGKWVELGA